MAPEIQKNVWPEWQIEKEIGKGSYGTVYKAVRRDHNVESFAAIKVVSIPFNESEIDSLRSEGLDMSASKTYFEGVVNDFVSEIQLMESLKGTQNIVSVEDYKVVEKTDIIGWDIYIRMELLTPFNTYICDKTLTEEEVIKLGCDICSALEICGKRNIIHMDIKPENIFVNDFGDFKLGDFGIARKLENSTGGFSMKGSPNYIAPEVAKGNDYDSSVDTYSLGIVLYRMLNDNRLPFWDMEKQIFSHNERRLALDRRLSGEPLPPPCSASSEMANLILCACAYDPKQRFASASAMKQALINVKNGTYQTADLDRTVSVRKAPEEHNESASSTVNTFTPKKKRKGILVAAVLLIVAVIIASGTFVALKLFNIDSQIEDPDSANEGNSSSDIDDGNTPAISEQSDSENEEQINSIISEAESLAGSNDYKGALDMLQNGLKEYPESNELKTKAEEYSDIIEKQINSVLNESEELAKNDNYEDAIIKIQTVIDIYPESDRLTSKMKEYKEAYEVDALNKANEYLFENEFDDAIKILNNAEKVVGTDSIISKKKEEVEKAKVFYPLEQYEEEEDYVSAIEYMNDKAYKYASDDLYIEKMSFYKDKYKNQIIASAKTKFDTSKYNEAINILNEGLVLLPDDSDLLEKIEEYKEYLPVNLFSLNYFDATTTDMLSGPYPETDNIGEKHNNAYRLTSSWAEDLWLKYKIDGKYNRLSGKFFLTFKDRADSRKEGLNIYGDGEIIYTTTIKSGVEPIEFDIDISGVKYLTISYLSSPWTNNCAFSDVYLYKN